MQKCKSFFVAQHFCCQFIPRFLDGNKISQLPGTILSNLTNLKVLLSILNSNDILMYNLRSY